MRDWLVASGIVEGRDGILLVQNRRRDGSLDWSPPGGVVEVDDGETSTDALTREVREETGITVTDWNGQVYRAVSFEGELSVDDPDGIVVDARFVPLDDCPAQLAATTWVPTHEPLIDWLDERWDEARAYRYRIDGASRADFVYTRL